MRGGQANRCRALGISAPGCVTLKLRRFCLKDVSRAALCSRRFRRTILALPLVRAQQPAPQPASEEYVRAHYTKYEYRIPMRDGVRLFTAVYVPKASAFPADPGPYPFLMNRTPYSVAPYGEDRYPAQPRTLG